MLQSRALYFVGRPSLRDLVLIDRVSRMAGCRLAPVSTSQGTMSSAAGVKTRVLIMSDTHSALPQDIGRAQTDDDTSGLPVPVGYREPLPEADVAIHCGDLTVSSAVYEFERTIQMMRGVRAPLKLVIAGNHDLALDRDFRSTYFGSLRNTSASETSVLQLFDDARQDGVRYLEEGTHSFVLRNGARLTVYASPLTPRYGSWAFQYDAGSHTFDIPRGVDIAMTHGPPRDILDHASNGDHAGCIKLFQAIEHARPKIHCFGHIHEGWGCLFAPWKDADPTNAGGDPRAITSQGAIDMAKSRLTTLRSMKRICEPEQVGVTGPEPLGRLVDRQSVLVDLTDDRSRLESGRQTLFINAAINDRRYRAVQRPFLVDVYLDRDGGDFA